MITEYSTKAAKVDDRRKLARAYDRYRDSLCYTIRYEGFDRDLVWEIPQELHHWRDRHSDKFRTVDALVVSEIERLVAELEVVKATPVKERTSKPRKEATGERMTCQICGGRYLANDSVIANHGYRRIGYGSYRTSCPGSRQLPYEVSCDYLREYVDGLQVRLDQVVAQQNDASLSDEERMNAYSRADALSYCITVQTRSLDEWAHTGMVFSTNGWTR